MFPVKWYAAHLAQEPLTPFSFERPDPGRQDVRVEILFCGFVIPNRMLRLMNGVGRFSPIEMISIDQIRGAYERVLKSEVKYRFVIDMVTLK